MDVRVDEAGQDQSLAVIDDDKTRFGAAADAGIAPTDSICPSTTISAPRGQ